MGPRKVHLHSLPLCQYSCLETQNRTDQLVYVYIYVTVEWQVRNLKGRQAAGWKRSGGTDNCCSLEAEFLLQGHLRFALRSFH